MVQRSDLIARASRSPDGVADNMSVESLEARQATERALVNEARAAIEADIAALAGQARRDEGRVPRRRRHVSSSTSLRTRSRDRPQLSSRVLLSSNRARHRG